jgi:hypothetical protein
LNVVVLLLVIVCLAGLAYQRLQIRALQRQVSESRLDLDETTREAVAMQAVLESQNARIELLEATSPPMPGELQSPTAEQLELLRPGIYVLETSTPYDPDAEETARYEITHVIVEMRYDHFGTRLHIGVAKTGWVPRGVYFDYDDDGRVDTDMAFEFVRDIPIVGRRLAKAYGPEQAQNLYSIFINEAEDARFTSIEELGDDAEAASSYVWTFLMDYYDAIEAWVLERLREEHADDGAAPQVTAGTNDPA